MKSSGQNISLLVDKAEFDLIDQACEYGADAYHIIDKTKREKGKYKLNFSYEELDDLASFLASDANPEESPEKEKKLNTLCDRIEDLLKAFKEPQTSPTFRYFIFDVWLEGENKKKIIRTIQIASVKSLYNFAKVITKAPPNL